MSLHLEQMIYTSFREEGFISLVSPSIPKRIQQVFLEEIVYNNWDSYNPPAVNFRSAYLYQFTLEDNLFGWLYSNETDDWGRNVPYFICYYLAGSLRTHQLESIFTCLQTGPIWLIDRQNFQEKLEPISIPDRCAYQPAGRGVVISADIQAQSHLKIDLGEKLNLYISCNSDTQESTISSNDLSVSPVVVPKSLALKDLKPTSSMATNVGGAMDARPQYGHRQKQDQWSLRRKSTTWTLATSILPALVVGVVMVVTSYSIQQHLANNPSADEPTLAQTTLALQKQQQLLLMGAGAVSVLAGAITSLWVQRLLRPALFAAEASTHLVNRLHREDLQSQMPAIRKDELSALETNLSNISMRLPHSVSKQEADAELIQVLRRLAQRLQSCRSEEEVQRIAVSQARELLNADRVSIFRYHSPYNGSFVEESVVPGWPKLGLGHLSNAPIEATDVNLANTDWVRATANLYESDLPAAQISFLEQFRVRAELVVPIFTQDRCWGLLIIHQCSDPHDWQQLEVNVCTQIAILVGLALDNASLLRSINHRIKQAQLGKVITQRIRTSLTEEDILNTTVVEVRKALSCDRVIVYSFDANGYGSVVAESGLPGVTTTLSAKIEDSCFTNENLFEQYKLGQAQAIDDIYAVGLSECFIKQLEYFTVKAYVAAPILINNHVFGLLIVHQCSGPRLWQQTEVDLVGQIAIQVGFALHHTEALSQVQQTYHTVQERLNQQGHQTESFHHTILEVLTDNDAAIKALATDAFNQTHLLGKLDNQIKTVTEVAQEIIPTIRLGIKKGQNINQSAQSGLQTVDQIHSQFDTLQAMAAEAVTHIGHIDQPVTQLNETLKLLIDLIAQIKLQAMNVTLEATRTGESGHRFAAMGEKIHTLAQLLDTDLVRLQPLAESVQSEIQNAATKMFNSQEESDSGQQLVVDARQQLSQIADYNYQIEKLTEQTIDIVTKQAHISIKAGQAIEELSHLTNQVRSNSQGILAAFEKLTMRDH